MPSRDITRTDITDCIAITATLTAHTSKYIKKKREKKNEHTQHQKDRSSRNAVATPRKRG